MMSAENMREEERGGEKGLFPPSNHVRLFHLRNADGQMRQWIRELNPSSFFQSYLSPP